MPLVSANGVHIAFEQDGPADAPAILLIPGFAQQLIHWPPGFRQALVAGGFRVIAMDNRDFGASQKFDATGAKSYGLADMAGDAAALLQVLAVSRAHLVGVSMGAAIAQWLALKHRRKVASLSLMMGASPAPGLAQAMPDLMQRLQQPPADPTNKQDYVENGVEIAELLHGPRFPFDAARVRGVLGRTFERDHDIAGMARQMQAMAGDVGRLERLADISAPTLVLHGSADVLVPAEHGQDLAGRIAGARLEVIEGWGHEIYSLDQDPIFAELILAHCRGA